MARYAFAPMSNVCRGVRAFLSALVTIIGSEYPPCRDQVPAAAP